MSPRARRFALAASVLTLACSGEAKQENPRAVPMAIEAQNRAWMRAVKRGDAPAVAALYADSAALYVPSTDVLVGRPAVENFYKGAAVSGLKEMRLTMVHVLTSGSMAREIGRYTATIQPPNAVNAVHENGKYVTVWTRQLDGSWKIDSHIWNAGGAGALPAAPDSSPVK
ncbi:MAG: nuclear transport factor 2 family protein [Gemmatimonadaceae bacterium]